MPFHQTSKFPLAKKRVPAIFLGEIPGGYLDLCRDKSTTQRRIASSPPGMFQNSVVECYKTWRRHSFLNWLVNVNIEPATDYEPDPFDFEDTKSFIITSPNLFEGSRLLPFQQCGGIKVRFQNHWIPFEQWLEFWLSTAASSINLDIRIAAQNYLDECPEVCLKDATARLVKMPVEIQLMVFDILIKDLDILIPMTRGSFFAMPSEGSLTAKAFVPSLNKNTIRPSVLERMIPDRYILFDDFSEVLDWQFSRLFTQYLLSTTIAEFQSVKAFRDFMSNAPLSILNDLTWIRFCWSFDPSVTDTSYWDHSIPSVFDALGAKGYRPHPDWTLGALAYLPSLKSVEIYFPAMYEKYSPSHFDWEGPCRTAFSNFMIESFLPWIALPGVTVKLSGAIRTSQSRHFNDIFESVREHFLRHPGSDTRFMSEAIRHELCEACRQYQMSIPTKYRHCYDWENSKAFKDQLIKHRKARNAFKKLKEKFVYDDVPRLYVCGNSVSTRRASQKIVTWDDLPPRPICACVPPCFPVDIQGMIIRDQDIFFDDTEQGTEDYSEWTALQLLQDVTPN